MKPLVSRAARILGFGDELSEVNKKLQKATHDFLSWFCPLVAEEVLPFADWWVSKYGNDAVGLSFMHDTKRHEVRSDGYDCHIQDYHAFSMVLASSEEKLVEWLQQLVRQRRSAIEKMESVPVVVDYQPARSKTPIIVGRTDCDLIILRSHPDFPHTLTLELEGTWTNTNPAWPQASTEWLLTNTLDPPCHTNWEDFDKERKEEKEGLTAFVIYVRPGPPPKPIAAESHLR